MSALIVESPRFGRIEAQADDLIHFDGLPGFERARRFVLRGHDRESPFGWLVCVDQPELGFVVTDPHNFFPDYRLELGPKHRGRIDAEEDAPIVVLAIVKVRGKAASLNLAAPIVVNPKSRRGAQLILEASSYSTREPIPEPKTSD